MQLYLCPSHQKTSLLQDLFNSKRQAYLTDVKICSLNSYINEYLNQVSLLDIYQAIKGYPSVFSDVYQDIGFLNELRNIKREIEAHQIQVDDLNIQDDLINLIKRLPDFGYNKLFNQINNSDYSNTKIVDSSYDFLSSQIIDLMVKKGASIIPSSYEDHQDFKDIKTTSRQSIETAIQYIINQDLDLNDIGFIALGDNQKLIRASLMRYQMPHFFLHDERVNNYALKLVSLIDFYLNPSFDNYINILNNRVFKFGSYELVTYLRKHVAIGTDLNQEFKRFENEEPYYKQLEEKANEVHLKIYPKLMDLIHEESFIKYVIKAFDFINDGNENIYSLKAFLENYHELINEDSWFILREELVNLKIKDPNNDGIMIGELFDGIHRKYLFVFDAGQDNFPAFKTLTGLANEASFENTTYPSLKERYLQHQKRIAYLSHSKETYYMFSSVSYEGKSIEMPSLIEAYQKIDLPLVELNRNYRPVHQLSKEISQRVFFDEGVLKGSVSALEKYMGCHYAYYLNYILGLYEDRTFELNAACIGSIIHEVFENAISQFGKKYTDIDRDMINSLLDKSFNHLDNLYPNDHYKNQIVKENLAVAIELELEFLRSLESETDFIPREVEYNFNEMFVDDDDVKVFLKGFIDRIDFSEEYFRIIDYKTSTHTLNKDKISKGLQLQLMTYLLVYEKVSGLKGMGAYYLNVNHPKISYDDYSYSIRDGLKRLDNEEKLDFIKNHKLKGLALVDYPGLDYNFNFVTNNGKKQISKNYLIDHDTLKEAFNSIYRFIYKSMESGDISLNPNEDACKYCIYKTICHFKGGNYYPREVIYPLDKEEEDEA